MAYVKLATPGRAKNLGLLGGPKTCDSWAGQKHVTPGRAKNL